MAVDIIWRQLNRFEQEPSSSQWRTFLEPYRAKPCKSVCVALIDFDHIHVLNLGLVVFASFEVTFTALRISRLFCRRRTAHERGRDNCQHEHT